MIQISVVMPVKNARTTAERAVHSIQGQTFKNWELILIDDHSDDGTTESLKRFAGLDPRIRCETSPKAGIVNALNHGIEMACGENIARMDADDFSHPRRLELQFSFLNENKNIDLVGTCVNFKGDPETQRGYGAYVEWTNTLLNWTDIRSNRFIESPFAHPSVMFRSSLIRGGEGPYRSGPFPEDYELWLRWMDEGIRMAKLEGPLLDWYDLPNRLSRTDPRYDPKAFYQTKAVYLANWLHQQDHTKRPIWMWGAGRITRQRSNGLKPQGIKFAGYIDIDPKKIGGLVDGLQVIHPDDVDSTTNPFIISYVGNRGARDIIRSYLLEHGFREEKDFILAA